MQVSGCRRRRRTLGVFVFHFAFPWHSSRHVSIRDSSVIWLDSRPFWTLVDRSSRRSNMVTGVF